MNYTKKIFKNMKKILKYFKNNFIKNFKNNFNTCKDNFYFSNEIRTALRNKWFIISKFSTEHEYFYTILQDLKIYTILL